MIILPDRLTYFRTRDLQLLMLLKQPTSIRAVARTVYVWEFWIKFSKNVQYKYLFPPRKVKIFG
jgi:hypothetical protein